MHYISYTQTPLVGYNFRKQNKIVTSTLTTFSLKLDKGIVKQTKQQQHWNEQVSSFHYVASGGQREEIGSVKCKRS